MSLLVSPNKRPHGVQPEAWVSPFSRAAQATRRKLCAAGIIVVLGASSGASAEPPKEIDPRAWPHLTSMVRDIVDGHFQRTIATAAKLTQLVPQPQLDGLVGIAVLASGDIPAARKLLRRACAPGVTEPRIYYWAARAALADRDLRAARAHLRRAFGIGPHVPEIQMAMVILHRGPHGDDLLRSIARVEPSWAARRLYPSPPMGAVELLAGLLRGFPHPMELLRTEGHLYFRCGALFAARQKFQRLVKKRPKDADGLQMLARCAAELGDPKKALALAEKAAERGPYYGPAQQLYGKLLLAAGRIKEALPSLRRGADALPQDATGLALLADACREAGQTRCATKFYRYALRWNPKLASVHYGLGLLEQEQGRYTKAGQHFSRAVNLEPSDERYHAALAQVAQIGGHRAKARRHLRHRRQARAFRKRFTQKLQREQRAITALREAIDACAVHNAKRRAPAAESAKTKGSTTSGPKKSAPESSRTRGGGTLSCAASLKKMRLKRRRFFEAHLALRGGGRDPKTDTPRKPVPSLNGSPLTVRLFSPRASQLVHVGRVAGQKVALRRQLPLASVLYLP